MKLLTADIGNTTINFGLFENERLKKIKIPTEKFREIPFGGYDNAVIASVVPSATLKVMRRLKVKPVILDYKNIPIKIKLENPGSVGSDRLVNAFAAREFYGAPSVVIDMGTATTFDFVSKAGDYIGGVIAPGIRISAESLFEKTEKLPKIIPEIPKKVIGKNTKEAMLSGIFFGHVGLIKEVMERVESKKTSVAGARRGKIKNMRVILTGGFAGFFKPYFPDFIIDGDITLKGMKMIFEKIPLMA